MSKLGTAFFALPSENAGFVSDWKERFNFRIGAVWFFPFSAREIESLDETAEEEFPRRVLLTPFSEQLELQVNSTMELQEGNPAALVLDIGQLIEQQLKESFLTAGESSIAFQNITADLKKKTRVGLWVVNPITGAKIFSRRHRYTKGVASLSTSIALCPPAGWNRFYVTEP